MKVRLRSAAEADVAATIRWYDQQRPGLGARFLEALDSILEGIERNPNLYQVVHHQTRRALFPRPFPYVVLFRVEDGRISIYAVLHQARDPAVWTKR